MELHGVHRDLLSFSDRPEKLCSIKHAANHSILMSDQVLDSSGSESDMTVDHVTHSRELDINTRSPVMKLRFGGEKRQMLDWHSLAHIASFRGLRLPHGQCRSMMRRCG